MKDLLKNFLLQYSELFKDNAKDFLRSKTTTYGIDQFPAFQRVITQHNNAIMDAYVEDYAKLLAKEQVYMQFMISTTKEFGTCATLHLGRDSFRKGSSFYFEEQTTNDNNAMLEYLKQRYKYSQDTQSRDKIFYYFDFTPNDISMLIEMFLADLSKDMTDDLYEVKKFKDF